MNAISQLETIHRKGIEMPSSNVFKESPNKLQPEDFDEIPCLTGKKRRLSLAVEAELIEVYQHDIPIDIGPFTPGRVAEDWAAQYDSGEHGGALAVAAWYLRKYLDVGYSELEGDEPCHPVEGLSDISVPTHRLWGEVGKKDNGKRFIQNLGIKVERRQYVRSSVWWESDHWREATALLFFPYGEREGLLKKSGRPYLRSSEGWEVYWFVPNYDNGLVK